MSFDCRFSTLKALIVVFAINGMVIGYADSEPVEVDSLPKLHDHVMHELGLTDAMLAEALDRTPLTEEEYRHIKFGVYKLWEADLSAAEIVSLDAKFFDGVDAVEWIDFLSLFGRGEDTEWAEFVASFDEFKKRPKPGSPDVDEESGKAESEREIEEVVAYGYSFSRFPVHPQDFSVQDIRSMRLIRERANLLYREGRYAKAYPMLLELAKRGFRDAQSRIAYILFNGAGNIQKSNLRALGWLGAASSAPTEPAFRVLFNRYMREVPEYVRPLVEDVVHKYREAFSYSEYLQCSTEHPYTLHHGSSIVKRTFCRYRIEAIAEACRGNCWVDKVNAVAGSDTVELPVEEIWKEWHERDLLEDQYQQ